MEFMLSNKVEKCNKKPKVNYSGLDGINRQKTNEYSRFIRIRITKNNGQHSSDAPHAIIELRLENHRNPSVDLRCLELGFGLLDLMGGPL